MGERYSLMREYFLLRRWSHHTRRKRVCDRVRQRTSAWPYDHDQTDLWLWKSEWLCRKDVTFELLRHWTFLSWLLYKEKKRKEEGRKFFLCTRRKQFCAWFLTKTGTRIGNVFKSSPSSCFAVAVNHSHVSYSVDDLLTRTEISRLYIVADDINSPSFWIIFKIRYNKYKLLIRLP